MQVYGLSLVNEQKWYLVDTIEEIVWFKDFIEVYGFKPSRCNGPPKIIVTRNNSSKEPPRGIITDLREDMKEDLPVDGWQVLNSRRAKLWFHARSLDVICEISENTAHTESKERVYEIVSALLFPIYIRAFAVGGLPLHAALIEYNNQGFLLVGGSGTGKTTCCRRIPAPWRPLCEEEVLIMRDRKGHYVAHPFPNLHDFAWYGLRRSYEVQRPVPVKGIFFLEQGKIDKTIPMGCGASAPRIYKSASEALLRYRKYIRDDMSAHRKKQFANACDIIRKTPAFILSTTLNGQFWEQMDRVIAHAS
jgi:SynChlorMet cassette protein ScmC